MAVEVSVFSFFSGVGILDLAFEMNHYDIVFVNENNPCFLEAYQFAREHMNMQEPLYGFERGSAERCSIRRGRRNLLRMIEAERAQGKVVGFIGGPPCPDFSVAGKNAGADGEHGRLTRTYFNTICHCKPDFFVFENVKGLVNTEKHKKFYNEMKCMVRSNHFIIADKLLNALEYGVPQFRERILMVGVADDIFSKCSIYHDGHGTLLFPWGQDAKYEISSIINQNWPKPEEFVENSTRFLVNKVPAELTVEYWFKKNGVSTHPNGDDFFQVRKGEGKIARIQEGDTKGKSFKRLHRWKYSPTAAYGHNEVHLHPYRRRRISVAEAMAIQSLPREFILPENLSLSSKFKMVGNGVPYMMASAIAHTLKDLLDRIVEE